MKLKEMSLFEAAEMLDIEIEETTEGLRLTHGENDPAAYGVVTLETAAERITDSREAYERMLEAKYSPMITAMVEEIIVDSYSAWTTVSDYLKSLEVKVD